MGAYAIEQVRTAFEHLSTRVRILCRRHGLIAPQMVDYMNYVRPVDDGFDHPVTGRT